MKYRGYLATFEEVWADSEEQALKKMAEKISGTLLSGESGLVAWEVEDMPEPHDGDKE